MKAAIEYLEIKLRELESTREFHKSWKMSTAAERSLGLLSEFRKALNILHAAHGGRSYPNPIPGTKVESPAEALLKGLKDRLEQVANSCEEERLRHVPESMERLRYSSQASILRSIATAINETLHPVRGKLAEPQHTYVDENGVTQYSATAVSSGPSASGTAATEVSTPSAAEKPEQPSKGLTLTKQQREEMLNAAKPLIKWFNDNAHAECQALVDNSVVVLVEGIASCHTAEFLKD